MSVKTFKSEFPLNERKQITGNVKKKYRAYHSVFYSIIIPIKDFSLGLIVLIFVGLFCDLYVLRLIIKK